jgi:hypothetical protein
MTQKVLPPILCASCGRQNAADSRFCSGCGKVISTSAKIAYSAIRPKSLHSLAVFGILTAVISLYSVFSSVGSSGPHDAYQTFSRVFDVLGLPLNAILLVASIGMFGPPKLWAKIWMLRWAGLVTVYETLMLLIAVVWIGPRATAIDIGLSADEMSQLNGMFSANQAIGLEYTVYWISMISLVVWAWWVLTRPTGQNYFNVENANSPSSIS